VSGSIVKVVHQAPRPRGPDGKFQPRQAVVPVKPKPALGPTVLTQQGARPGAGSERSGGDSR